MDSEFEANSDFGNYFRIKYRVVIHNKCEHKVVCTETIVGLELLKVQFCESDINIYSNMAYICQTLCIWKIY